MSEGVLLWVAAYLGFFLRFGDFPSPEFFDTALIFSLTILASMVAMGVYGSRLREGFTGMLLRTAVSFFLLGTALIAVLSFLMPDLGFGRGVFLISTITGFILSHRLTLAYHQFC